VIEKVTDLPAGTLSFRASGKITSEEYRQMIEPIYAALERGDKLKIYFELAEDFHGLDSGPARRERVRLARPWRAASVRAVRSR
jgi:hypothetical protein